MREWLKNLRKDKDLTQKNVAAQSFINRSYYTQIENGTRSPSIEVALNIAKVLGFNPILFFENFNNPFDITFECLPLFFIHCDLDFNYVWIYTSDSKLISEDYVGKNMKELDFKSGLKELLILKNEAIQTKTLKKKIITFCPRNNLRISSLVYTKPLLNTKNQPTGVATFSVLV